MSLPSVQFRGSWPLAALMVDHVASTQVPDAEVDALVDAVWARQRSAAALGGSRLVDGPAYRMEGASATANGLVLSLATGPYRRHSALKELHADPRIRRGHHDRTLVVDALVTTADDQVLLLRTPKPVGIELQLVGGTATPGQHAINCGADIAEFAAARIGSALKGTGPVEVRRVLGLVEHVVGCVNLVLDVRLDVPARAVTVSGTADLVVVPTADLGPYLRESPGYLPAVADLL